MIRTLELSSNKKGIRLLEIYETYECGLVLSKEQLKKSINFQISLSSCYGWIKESEIFLKNFGESDKSGETKLLLHKQQIRRIIKLVKEKKYQLIPTKIYLKNHKVKVELALAKYDRQKRKNTEIEKLKESSWKKLNMHDDY